MILEILGSITYGPTVQPACIPGANDAVADGTKCLISGWGDTQDHVHNRWPDKLQKVSSTFLHNCFSTNNSNENAVLLIQAQVEVFARAQCLATYPESTENMICAGLRTGGIDSCQVMTLSTRTNFLQYLLYFFCMYCIPKFRIPGRLLPGDGASA